MELSIKQLTQSDIHHLCQKISNSKTQQQIKQVQQIIRQNFLNQKNLSILTSIILSKQTSNQYKTILLTFFNLIVQQHLYRYEQNKSKNKLKPLQKSHDQIRKDIISVTSKLQKIIDNNNVSVFLKPKLVYLQLKMYNRSKEDWDGSRVLSKMEFYLRKDMVIVAQAYFKNSLKLGFSMKEKIDLIRKAVGYLPNNAGKSLLKIVKGMGFSQSPYKSNAYIDFKCSMNSILDILKNVFIELSQQITLQWCNSQIFLNILQTIVQKIITNYNKIYKQINPNSTSTNQQQIIHPQQQLKQWQQILIKILKKLTDYIQHHTIILKCQKFIQIFYKYIKYLGQVKYLKYNQLDPKQYQHILQDYLPLFINAARLQILPNYFHTLKPCNSPQSLQQLTNYTKQQTKLTQQQKLYILKIHIIPLYKYIICNKICNFLYIKQSQTHTQFLQYFKQFSSIQELDYMSDNFQYNLALFLITLVQKYKHIGYYLKRLIYCLLLNYPSNSNNPNYNNIESPQYWVNQQLSIFHKLPQQYNNNPYYKIQIGMMLSLLLYKYLSKDINFIQQCITVFINRITQNNDINDLYCIFNTNPQTLTIFLIFFQNYMQQIPIFTKGTNQRINSYPYSPFIKILVNNLCMDIAIPSLPIILINFLLHYIKLIKQIIRAYKETQIYKKYHNNIEFMELEQPLQQFHKYQNKIPIKYCCQLYKDIIQYSIFRIQGQIMQDTVNRAKNIVEKIIMFQGDNQQNGNLGRKQYYMHQKFKLLGVVVSCQQYSSLFNNIFQWINKMSKSRQWFNQYQQDIIDLCLVILRKSQLFLGLDQYSLQRIWQVIYIIIKIYKWQQYQIDGEVLYTNNNNLLPKLQPQSNLIAKRLQIIYLSSTYHTYPQLTNLLFITCKQNLHNISLCILNHKRTLKLIKYRPYQIQQLTLLLTLHKIILLHHQHLTPQTITSLLQLYWNNLTYHQQFPQQFNYINGKYKLIIILLMHYQIQLFTQIISAKNINIINKIYHDIFYHQQSYRVQYDANIFIVHSLEIVKKIWNKHVDIKYCQYILKYAHFVIGGCIFVLDRIYQNYRYAKNQQLEIQVFSDRIRDPILTTNLQINNFIKYLIKQNYQMDQFDAFRQFYNKIKDNQNTFKWFINSMQLYVRTQIYIDHYYDVLNVRKIKRSDGIVLMRIFRNAKKLQSNL